MGIFQFTRPRNDLSLTDSKSWNRGLWNLLGAQSSSGVQVDEQTALNYSAVFCAINLLSSTISCLPLRLLIAKDRKKIIASNKTAHQIVHTRWNKYMTAQVGREVLEAHILAWGNGYAEKVYNKQGDLAELWPIPPNRVTPTVKDGELLYDIEVGGEQKTFSRDKILHVPGLGFDGFTGYSVVAMARESIGLGIAMEKFGAKFFGNGAHLGAVLSHPGKLSEKAEDNLRKSFIEKQSGLDNAHRMLLLQEGIKIDKLGLPPEDSQFIEGRQFQITDIARWFNIPPHKLKDMTKSSFNNIESEQTSFVIDSILPRCVRLESNFGMQLLSDLEQRQGYYFNHNLAGLLRGDSEARAKLYTALFNLGSISPDEIREKEDFDPLPDGIGNRYFVQLNMAPLDKFDEVMKNVSKSQEVIKPGDGKQTGGKQEQ